MNRPPHFPLQKPKVTLGCHLSSSTQYFQVPHIPHSFKESYKISKHTASSTVCTCKRGVVTRKMTAASRRVESSTVTNQECRIENSLRMDTP